MVVRGIAIQRKTTVRNGHLGTAKGQCGVVVVVVVVMDDRRLGGGVSGWYHVEFHLGWLVVVVVGLSLSFHGLQLFVKVLSNVDDHSPQSLDQRALHVFAKKGWKNNNNGVSRILLIIIIPS